MTRPSLARALLTAAVLTAGCLSRWSGCRHYDAGRLAGAGWTARVTCDPHTEVDLAGLHGCTARWSLVVERGPDVRVAELRGPRHASADCGEVRRLCASARGELAQRATPTGTWVAGRAPGGDTRLAFVPSACGTTYLPPPDAAPALPPGEAVARRPDDRAFLDGVVARETILGAAWTLVCGPALASRVAAVRAAALECRVPEGVADELFRTDPTSVGAVWEAFVAERLPCSEALRRDLREHAATALGEVVLAQLATCETRCPPRARVEALREAGTLRLPGARGTALRLASPGPPPWVARDDAAPAWTAYRDAYDAWLAAQWALSQIDPERGTALALATLRRLPPTPGVARLPVARGGPPTADDDDPGTALCAIVLGDPARARAGLWQVASDEGASEAGRQHALLALARLGDPRASGATLAHNPLTAEQAALVQASTAPPGGASPGGGHHHHHWH